jgi:hypothetical protein
MGLQRLPITGNPRALQAVPPSTITDRGSSLLPSPTTSTAYRMRDNTANSLASELDGGRRAAYIVPGPELSIPLTLEAGRVMRTAEGLSDISAALRSHTVGYSR